MSELSLYIEVITPEKLLFSGEIVSVDVPGADGSFTILRNHAPIVSVLKQGDIRLVVKFKEELVFECKGGVVEMSDNTVSILLD